MKILSPKLLLSQGIDVHCLFDLEDIEKATIIYNEFLKYLSDCNVTSEHARIFERPVGPWPTPMWQLVIRPNKTFEKFEEKIGKVILWLMLNRDQFSVMIHPNTSKNKIDEFEFGGDLLDHTQYVLWLGKQHSLKIDIFKE